MTSPPAALDSALSGAAGMTSPFVQQDGAGWSRVLLLLLEEEVVGKYRKWLSKVSATGCLTHFNGAIMNYSFYSDRCGKWEKPKHVKTS